MRSSFARRGFTLVEMLVSIAVLGLLAGILSKLIASASEIAEVESADGNSGLEAKQVLDRIGTDIASMLVRPDVDQYYLKVAGNDEFYFYSQAQSVFADSIDSTQQSPVALIGYRISSTVNNSGLPVLQRIAEGMTWDQSNASLAFLVFPARTSVTQALTATTGTIPSQWPKVVDDSQSDTNWQVVGNQIFRMEVCFQLRDGSFTLTPPTPSTMQAPSTSGTSPAPPVAGSIVDTVGMIVALGVLDTRSRQVVPAGAWPNLTGNTLLRDPSVQDFAASPSSLMDSIWTSAVQQGSFSQAAGIPSQAASQIKIYQRYYPLNAPKSY